MPRRDLFLLLALALLFNFSLAAFVTGPLFEDDAYYFGGALRLARGQGFTEPYLWNYLGDPPSLPRPSHLYWMPLTSVLAALSMMVFGQTFAAARFPLLLFASFLPLITYYSSLFTTGLRRHALAAGLLTIFCGYYAIFWATTDSFAVYAVVASLTFVAAARSAETKDWRLKIAAGIGAGLAHLARADGVLGLLSLVLWSIGQQLLGKRRWSVINHQSPIIILGYLLVMLPWFIRNTLVAGSPLGAGGAGTLWLIEYNDLFNYPSNVTPARYFAAGLGVILGGKWEAFTTNLQRVIAEQGLIFLTPLIIVGLWQLRKHTLYRNVMLFAALLYAAMTFAFSFPGARGGLFHSGAALLPFYFPAALVGLDAVVDWIAARLKHWKPEIAKRNFTILLVALAALFTLAVTVPRLSNLKEDPAYALLRDLPKEAVVMSNNPPGVWAVTGHPGIPLPNGDGDTVVALADKFNVRYVVMDHNITPGLAPLYQSDGTEWLKLVKQEGEVKLFEVIQ
jgi:4-amino-4-deoxy-L-arabinose transferase-like glycosyltransferase